jgi:uncharacterized membrane protein
MDEKNKEQIEQIKASESGYKITDWKLYRAKQLNNMIIIIVVLLFYLLIAGAAGYLLGYEKSYDAAFNSLNSTCNTIIQAVKTTP